MILVTGANGFLGTHLCNKLKELDYEYYPVRHNDYDLRHNEDAQRLILRFKNQIDCVIHLAANVGGIGYNRNHPYQLLYDNITMNTNIIHQCIIHQIPKLVMTGTTCAYPQFCEVPFDEIDLWKGYPEVTNAAYGNAKRIAMEQLKAAYNQFDYNGITLIPTNLFGPGDNFDENKSHVIPAIIKKVFDSIDNDSNLIVWGSGKATRDFLYVDDCVDAIILAMEHYDNPLQPLNVGSGQETSIKDLVELITDMIDDFDSEIIWDNTKPDGQPRRLLDTGRIEESLNWQPKTSLKIGLEKTIEWYKEQRYNGR